MREMLAVKDGAAIRTVAALARETWVSHYTPIIGADQVAYMLEKFQSESAILEQLGSGYAYYLVMEDGAAAGYFALVPCAAEGRMMLSKIYILPSHQRRGLGRDVIAFALAECARRGLRTLWLTVNKRNAGSLAFYEGQGFRQESAVVSDIGGGFVMDDYVMARAVRG
jgi:GNAT superfamily N-acetyltransferase